MGFIYLNIHQQRVGAAGPRAFSTKEFAISSSLNRRIGNHSLKKTDLSENAAVWSLVSVRYVPWSALTPP